MLRHPGADRSPVRTERGLQRERALGRRTGQAGRTDRPPLCVWEDLATPGNRVLGACYLQEENFFGLTWKRTQMPLNP